MQRQTSAVRKINSVGPQAKLLLQIYISYLVTVHSWNRSDVTLNRNSQAMGMSLVQDRKKAAYFSVANLTDFKESLKRLEDYDHIFLPFANQITIKSIVQRRPLTDLSTTRSALVEIFAQGIRVRSSMLVSAFRQVMLVMLSFACFISLFTRRFDGRLKNFAVSSFLYNCWFCFFTFNYNLITKKRMLFSNS